MWALRDITLDVEVGEAVGIIGRNGAGKTTLLKILAGITHPTCGEARTRGRVGALLDVGTGFHPELTGRENVFLSAALLGMPRAEVEHRFDEIVEFSGVERFIDTPVKRYSTGMRLRLAFAVAAHIEPPVVVVDEVLAAGDEAFRERCLGTFGEATRQARTVLFVSHDLGAVTRVCSRAVWLDGGRVRGDGPTEEIVAAYLGSGEGEPLAAGFDGVGAEAVALTGVSVQDAEGHVLSDVTRGDAFSVQIRFAVAEPFPGLDLSVWLVDDVGHRVLDDARSDWAPDGLAGRPGSYVATVNVPSILKAGRYALGVWLGGEHETLIDREVLMLAVTPRHDDRRHSIERARVVQPKLDWTVVQDQSTDER